MRAALRTAWALTSVPAMIVLGCACVAMWQLPRVKPMRALLPLLLMIGLALFAGRIARMIQAGVWRLLPEGYRTLVRATGLLMLGITVVLGAMYEHVVHTRLAGLPLGLLLALFVHFSLLGALLLAGIGRRLPLIGLASYLFACSASLIFTMERFGDSPPFWIAAAGLCLAGWLYASFGPLPRLHASAVWARLPDLRAVPRLAFAQIRLPFVPRSPAHELLRSRRKARTGLPFAALIVVAWAGFQHAIGGGTRALDPPFLYPSVAWVTLFLVVMLSQDVGAAARTLWLRWGESRGDLFGLAERMLFREAAILCIVAWGTVTLLAWLRGPPIDAPGALKMLVAYLGAAAAPIYLALAFTTFQAWWQRLICAALCAGAVALLSFRWLDALGASRSAIRGIEPETLLVVCFIPVVLRTLASWRWKTIDWIYFRPTRTKQ